MKRFWMGLMTVLLAIAVTITINYAWFVNSYDVNPLADGSSVDAYYYTGSGTSGDPYVITTPRHLYNLAWLQYLGRYNKDAKSGTSFPATYFRLGMEADGTLDMSGWPLPPIGTTKYPFIGNFNGNGWTITGLTTTNTWSEFGTKHPSSVNQDNFEKANCSVIGFFGSIGAFNNSVISGADDVNPNDITTSGYTYDTTNNRVYNFYLNDNNVHTSNSTTLIGAVAGYVNAELAQIGVIQPHLNIQATGATPITTKTSSNLSDFAVVGYAEANYKTQKTKNSTIIYNPTYDYAHFNFKGMGSQADWGGSVDFKKMFTRIKTVTQNNASVPNYPTYQIQYSGINKSPVSVTGTASRSSEVEHYTGSGSVDQYLYRNLGDSNGVYLQEFFTNSNGGEFNCLTSFYKQLIIVTKTNSIDSNPSFIIQDNSANYYLNITSTRSSTNNLNFNVILNNSSNTSRVWCLDSTTHYLYTYNEDDGIKYYLNASSNNGVTISTTGSTQWTYDSENNGLYYTSTYRYYLKRYNNTWCTTPLYSISDGNGNYIKLSGTGVINTTNASEATVWYASTYSNADRPFGTFRAVNSNGSNSNNYLTINGQGLSVTDSGTTWSNSGSGLYDSNNNYIQFRNGYWAAMTNPAYKIGYSTNYLKKDGTNTNSDDAALWTFGGTLATSGGSGTVTFYDGATKYLTNNNGNLTVSTTATTWYNDGGNLLYCIYNNQRYYLVYDNGWKLETTDYYIKDSGSNYLTFNDSTSIKNATSATTLWHFSNASTYPQGTISCTDGNGTYYLEPNGTSVILSNTSTTTWVNDGDGLYCTIGGVKNYLVYDNGWKLVSYTYKISYNGTYLILDGNNLSYSTNQGSATEWTFSNGGTNPSGTISSNGYYLYLDANGVLITTTTAGSATVFSNAGSGLYDSNNNYIQFYNNKWVCGKAIRIQYDGHYLNTTDGNTISNSNTENSSSIWFSYSQNTELVSGPIYTVNNGSIKYLNPSTNYAMTLNTTYSIWYFTEDGITQENNSSDPSYIQYLSGNWYLTNGVTISYNNRYLNINGTQINTTSSTTPNCFWYFDNSNRVYTVINGTNYYLKTSTGNNPSLSINTGTGNNPLVYNGGKLYISKSESSGWGSRTYYYWLNLNNNTWRITRNQTNSAPNLNYYYFPSEYSSNTSLLSLNFTTSASTNTITYVNGGFQSLSFNAINKYCSVNQNDFSRGNDDGEAYIYTRSDPSRVPSLFTYIPLTTLGDKLQTMPTNYNNSNYYTVDDSNTGYIICGGYEGGYNEDIRISKFAQSDIADSFNGTNLIDNSVYTIGANGLGLIKDSAGTPTDTYYDNTSNQLFSKYQSSKEDFEKSLGSNIYGIHFMNSEIQKNHQVVLPSAIINGETYTEYAMPEDCIDFKLKSKGIINFWSGYYFRSNNSSIDYNNCFFSLHEIIRDGDNNITETRHILKVYERNSDKEYIFYYENDDNHTTGYYYKNAEDQIVAVNDFTASQYTLKFDSQWIEDPVAVYYNTSNPSNTQRKNFFNSYWHRIFYFEIPVSKGEYALGSVSNTDSNGEEYTGTYLLYLDIGANASVVDRTTIMQESKTITQDFTYVNGIQILDGTAQTVAYTSDANSCVAIIKTTNTGVINITRTDNTISFGGVSLDSTYWDEGLTVPNGNLNNSAVTTIETITKVLKYIDFNNGTNKLYYTTVKDIGGNQTYETRRVNNDNTSTLIVDSNSSSPEDAEFGLLKIGTGDDAGYGVQDTAANAISTHNNKFSIESTLVDYYFYVPTSVRTNSGISESYDLNVSQVTDTGNVIVGEYTIANGTYSFNDGSNYTSTHCYKLIGDDITYVFTQIPTGTTTTTFVVTTKDGTYTVTINGTTIAVGNYTYTFSTNTIASA